MTGRTSRKSRITCSQNHPFNYPRPGRSDVSSPKDGKSDPASLALFDPRQCTPTLLRTEALQRASALACESLVAAWPVAGTGEKIVVITLAASLAASGTGGVRLLIRSR
jgi:hypothetical protein